MKKLLLCLLLCGCNFVPELIRNPACEETRDVNYTVFQVSKPYTLVESGNLYAIETKSLEQNIGELYDDKRFSTRGASSINYSTEQKRNMTCAVSDGTYTYTTALGTEKTVKKLKFIPMWISNPEYDKIQDEKAKKIE